MKSLLTTALLGLALVGCRTQPLAHPIEETPTPTFDLGVPDLPRVRDFAVPGQIACKELTSCFNGCRTEECLNDCYERAGSRAQNLYEIAAECLYSWCLEAQANLAPRCVLARNGEVRDPPDMGFGGCQRCLRNAFAELGGMSCDRNSPDCMPQGCANDVQACLNN